MSNDPNISNPTPQQPSEAPDSAKESFTRRVARKFLTGKGIFTFLRSSVSSQIASWIDMGVCFVFYAWVFLPLGTASLRSFLSTAIGLVIGGIVNCCINYRFTFRAEHCAVKAVAVKYFLIWGGSFVLNLGGTTLLEQGLHSLNIINRVTWIKPDGVFAVARLSVSLAVSLGWNFVMQKNFVYRPSRFDPFAISMVNKLTFRKEKPKA